MVADQEETDSDAALAGYGDAVDIAVKVPTLSGVLVALIIAAFVWTWRQLRQRRSD